MRNNFMHALERAVTNDRLIDTTTDQFFPESIVTSNDDVVRPISFRVKL